MKRKDLQPGEFFRVNSIDDIDIFLALASRKEDQDGVPIDKANQTVYSDVIVTSGQYSGAWTHYDDTEVFLCSPPYNFKKSLNCNCKCSK